MKLSPFTYTVYRVIDNDPKRTQLLSHYMGDLGFVKEQTIGALRLPLDAGYGLQKYEDELQKYVLLVDSDQNVHAKIVEVSK